MRCAVIVPPILTQACSEHVLHRQAFAVCAMLRRDGHSVVLADHATDPDGFLQCLQEDHSAYQAVCLVVFIGNLAPARELIDRMAAKRCRGRPKVLLVGSVAAYLHQELIARGLADIAVRIDAEFVVPQVLRAGFVPSKMARIPNITYRHEGRVRCNRQWLYDRLDEIPCLLPYYIERGLTLALETARGCPHGCGYCDKKLLNGGKIRVRSVGRVLEELALVPRSGALDVFFSDENFLAFPARVKAICLGMIRAKMTFRWRCNSRVDAPSFSVLKLMKLAGCCQVNFGVESGAAKIRRSLGKDFSLKKILQAVDHARQAEIGVGIYLMTGAPGESEREFEQTCKVLKVIAPDVAVINPVTLLPGTGIYAKYIALRREPKDFILDKSWPGCWDQQAERRSAVLREIAGVR